MARGKQKAIWELTRGQRLRYGAAIGALCVATVFSYLVPQVIRLMIDGIITGEELRAPAPVLAAIESVGGRTTLGRNLWVAGLLVVVITAVAGVFTYLKGRWSAIASESIARRVRDTLYDHLKLSGGGGRESLRHRHALRLSANLVGERAGAG